MEFITVKNGHLYFSQRKGVSREEYRGQEGGGGMHDVWKLGILINIHKGGSRKELYNLLMIGMGLNHRET